MEKFDIERCLLTIERAAKKARDEYAVKHTPYFYSHPTPMELNLIDKELFIGDYSDDLLAYVRATKDVEVMKRCCNIERHWLANFHYVTSKEVKEIIRQCTDNLILVERELLKMCGIECKHSVISFQYDVHYYEEIADNETPIVTAIRFNNGLISTDSNNKSHFFIGNTRTSYEIFFIKKGDELCVYDIPSIQPFTLIQIGAVDELLQQQVIKGISHFKGNRPEQQYTAIFNALTKGGYLAADGDLQGWLWVCTGTMGTQPTEPLKWHGTPTELALMVGTVFGKKWAVASADFQYKADSGEWKAPAQAYLSKQWGNSTIMGTGLGEILSPILNN